VTDPVPAAHAADIREARRLFPATAGRAYFNTAAVGLASRRLADTYHEFIDEWAATGLDYSRGEQAAGAARSAVARLIGADAGDIALIPAVSSAAGLVAAQFGPAHRGDNIVIGQREYSSNHFPWRQLAQKGYDVRQVPFRNGGLEPEDVGERVDGGTKLVAFSGVQTATGHRSDIAAISGLARSAGAIVFVDGAQLVGALPVARHLRHVDVLAAPDHKFLLNAGRGMGYCYLSPAAQGRFTPVSAGWRAGTVPFDSFFGPEMNLSPTASRFDSSISWLAAIGNRAALASFDDFGPDTIYARNRELTARLRDALASIGWNPVDLAEQNRSTIVSVPLGDVAPGQLLSALSGQAVISSARDGHLRLAIHFYNHEDDIERLVTALTAAARAGSAGAAPGSSTGQAAPGCSTGQAGQAGSGSSAGQAGPAGRAWLAALPRELAAQRRVMAGLIEFCEATPQVTSLSVGCSLGRGAADALSDIDAALGIAAERGTAGAGQVQATEAAAVAALPGLGALVEVLRHRIGPADRMIRRIFAQFADGTQLDLAVMAEAEVRRGGAAPDFVSLYQAAGLPDPGRLDAGRPEAGSPGGGQPAPAYVVTGEQVREWAFLGWCALIDADKYLRRGSLWEAHSRLDEARRHIWALWATAAGALYPWHGLSQVLDHDPGDLPPGIESTVAGLDPADLRRAARASAAVLARVSAAAAQRCPADLPAAMASYVTRALSGDR
jgi:cysteine desulfurase / selenocysteine lyase